MARTTGEISEMTEWKLNTEVQGMYTILWNPDASQLNDLLKWWPTNAAAWK